MDEVWRGRNMREVGLVGWCCNLLYLFWNNRSRIHYFNSRTISLIPHMQPQSTTHPLLYFALFDRLQLPISWSECIQSSITRQNANCWGLKNQQTEKMISPHPTMASRSIPIVAPLDIRLPLLLQRIRLLIWCYLSQTQSRINHCEQI